MLEKMHPVNRLFSIRGFFTAFPVAWDETFEFSGERHDFWEVVFFERGDVECVEDEKVYLVRDNCMLIHAPMEFHRIRSTPGSTPKGFIMSFKSEGDLPEKLKQGIFQLQDDEKEEYLSICQSARKIVQKNASPYVQQLAADHLSAFLIRLSEKPVASEIVRSNRTEIYRRIISEMMKHTCENLTLSDFAERQSISVSYLKLLFQEYAGISPKSYYNQLRVEQAISLLGKNLSLAEISEKMNFSSQNYFTVFFRKHMGIPPSEYRKKTERGE